MRSTDASTVATSSGRIVRRSTTSAAMPSAASSSAAASASGTPLPMLTMVRSSPARAIRALPSSIASPSGGASPFTEYSRLCSRNTTGFGSRIAPLSMPLASAGEDGNAILIPGTPWNHVPWFWEWIAPKRPPAPTAERTTSGQLPCSLETYQYFAAWLTSESIGSAMKSPNMISNTGRSPVTAAP